ncbi:hypothetical protein QCN27_03885 [Cereibacter sp. SYSU M97828]|nr:hypothetical protein [Cereibacter flavus]
MIDFAADTAAIFAGPLAAPVLYLPKVGEVLHIRAIVTAPDDTISFGSSTVSAATTVFMIQTADLANPAAEDRIRHNDVEYVVQGVPRRDSRRLRWMINTRPAR